MVTAAFSIFNFTSHSLDTQAMLNLILIDFQYLQNASEFISENIYRIFSFEKGSNGQNQSSSEFQDPVESLNPS